MTWTTLSGKLIARNSFSFFSFNPVHTSATSMDSDTDSGGSHISTTPPKKSTSSKTLDERLATLVSSTKSRIRTKTSTSGLDTARTTLRPKIPKRKSIRPSKSQIPPPENNSPVNPVPKSTSPVKIVRNLSTPNVCENAQKIIAPAIHCRSSSFFTKAKGKCINFEPDDVSIPGKSEVHVGTAESVAGNDDAGIAAMKNVRKNINLVGRSDFSDAVVKRAKFSTEGNFVKLNINGYGRKKFAFKSKGNNFRSSSRRRRFPSKNTVNSDKRDESGVFDEEGLVVNVKCGEEILDSDTDMVGEAVKRVRNEASDDNLVKLLKLTHGYDSFREGQLEAIKMVLSGKSTMLVLPTGAGKSLCYQLPALVFMGVTIVVSPLVALMIDQLKQLPPAIRGALLCSSQTAEEASETLRSLQEGAIKVLFVSPERFLNTEFITIFSGSSRLSLVVVDEAHCVSEWSHNFRPSYMRLRASLLCGKLNAGCILAMTATATTKALRDVMHALEIHPTNLIHSAKLRENLHLSASMSGNRMKDLMTLLKASPYSNIKSIIIYCKFQSETDMISKYLRDNSISAKSYHSGIPAKDRIRVQEMFCSNKIRVVVATVAFGMGLDKRDIGAVIHYSLPGSLEEYVQEIGRAGRDGRLSHCHLLFDDATYFKLRSLMHSEGVDEYTVNKLLSQIFSPEASATEICSLVKESASRKFDMKEEVIITILTQLELGEEQYIHLLPQMNVTCTLNFHQTSPAQLAAKDIVVAAILKKSEMKDGQYVFHMPSVVNIIRMQAFDLTNHLYSLKLKGEVTYELKDQSFCYKVLQVPKDVCSLAAKLTKWLAEIETCKVWKIDEMFNAASFAAKKCDRTHGCHENEHTSCLQRKILEYFDSNDNSVESNQIDQNSSFLRADVKVFLQSNRHAKFTPRAIARILHGIASPAFPSATWSRTHFWGRYTQIDFKVVMEAAKAELIKSVGEDVTRPL